MKTEHLYQYFYSKDRNLNINISHNYDYELVALTIRSYLKVSFQFQDDYRFEINQRLCAICQGGHKDIWSVYKREN